MSAGPVPPARDASRALGRPPAGERPDRRQAILLAAEKLFAQRGYHAITIRQIAEEAGVPLALVGYYFGQKHELFEAIFARWHGTVEARLQGLREAMAAGGRDLLRRIVQAFVTPVLALRASAEGESYARLVARELAYASPEADAVLRRHFDPLAEAFIDALHAALPRGSRVQAAWGYQFALGALLHHLSDDRIERLSRGEAAAHTPQAAPLLMEFIVAGLRALPACAVSTAAPAVPETAPAAPAVRPSRPPSRPASFPTPTRRRPVP